VRANLVASFRLKRAATLGLSLVLLLLGVRTGHSQAQPIGPEFQVNTLTTGSQDRARVSVAPDGAFVVVWGKNEPGWRRLRGQRFSASGLPQGGELAIDDGNSFALGEPDLGHSADSGFVVVWGDGESGPPGGGSYDFIHGRRFDSSAVPVGSQFAVSPPPGSDYTSYAKLAVQPDGSFVVAWSEEYDAFARRFMADGSPHGDPYPLPGDPQTSFSAAGAATLPDDGWMLAWREAGPSGYALLAQRYGASGIPVAPPQALEGPTPDWFVADFSVGATGELVLATTWWPDLVQGRCFDAELAPLGPPFAVNTYSGTEVFEPRVHLSSLSGEFVVAWSSVESPGDDPGHSVQARRFAADCTPLGDQFQVNSWTTNSQNDPDIVTLIDGSLLFTWMSTGSYGTDTSASSIQARIFRIPFFMDGFESGTTSRWSGGAALR